ncbi:hypothetical protein C1645_408139 [Glomus cerebriforme]|uniref:Uncharacterized protein n=1 Tax=Glomus cerebriforme TaxID=658196 RepID=A0A397SPQ9_9GLOM|nr:hypothetical protein C1645_408139 [Glomus cerebriforme]
MSTEEQQTSTISTNEEILDEQYEQYEDDEQQQQQQELHHEDDDVQNHQEEEVEESHQDLYQTVASSSTAESSNHTLRDDNLEHPPVIPRLNKHGIPTTYARLSDRYTFSFSADLISQFDQYRAHMRESIRQELEQPKIIEEPENSEEIFSVHQVHHEPAASVHSNSQNSREASIRDRSTFNATRPLSKQNRFIKYFGIPFLRGKSSKNSTRNATTITNTTTTLSDLATLSSDIDHHHHQQSELTNNTDNNIRETPKISKAKKYFKNFKLLFFKKNN